MVRQTTVAGHRRPVIKLVRVRRHVRRHIEPKPSLWTLPRKVPVTMRDYKKFERMVGKVPGIEYDVVGSIAKFGTSNNDIDIVAIAENDEAERGFNTRLRDLGLEIVEMNESGFIPGAVWLWNSNGKRIRVDVHFDDQIMEEERYG